MRDKPKSPYALPLVILLSLTLCFPAFCCTTVIVSAGASSSGRPVILKQRDTRSENNVLMHFHGNRFAFTGLIDEGDSSHVWLGANEAGFMISNSLSYNLSPASLKDRKLHAGRIMKEALSTCCSVDEFAALVDTMRMLGVEANLAVADVFGGAAYFEVWDSASVRYDVPKDGYLVRTNFSFSGRKGEGKGYERYASASSAMQSHSGKYSSAWLIDNIGRCFLLDGRNALASEGMLKDLPDVYIPRNTTTACIAMEGMKKGDAKGSAVLWSAVGYTPCCYAVPVIVSEGSEIPSFLREPQSCSLARELRTSSSIQRLGSEILPKVRRAEAREFRSGAMLVCKSRRGKLSQKEASRARTASENRFSRFKAQF